jgi:hypothetical protein
VHPIERLRYVARAAGVDQRLLVAESASALSDLGFDPQGIVTSCRRLIQKHPSAGALWWLSARLMTAVDPMEEAWRCVEEIDDDPTGEELRFCLPEGARVVILGWPDTIAEAVARSGGVNAVVVDVGGEGHGLIRRLARSGVEAEPAPVSGLAAAVVSADLVLLDAWAMGAGGMLSIAGARAAASVAYVEQIPVWAVAGVGRVLPSPLWDALAARLEVDEPWNAEAEILPLGVITALVGPTGLMSVEDLPSLITCGAVEELLRPARL